MVYILQFLYNKTLFAAASARALFWGLFVKNMGMGCQFMEGVKIGSPGGVQIGSNVCINHHCEIGGQFGLKIGNQVMIGPYSQILTANHSYKNFKLPMKEQGIEGGQVVIEDDVWIGAFAVILPNIKIGRGAIIGAHSVVTHNIKPYSIVGGVPAKLIKYRFPKGVQNSAKKISWI